MKFVCQDRYRYFIWLPTHIRSFNRKHYSSPTTKRIHFLSVKKKKHNIFFLVTDNFLNHYYYLSPLINYPLSGFFFFFINADDKIFRWTFIVSAVHIFYGITTARFHLRRIQSARQVYCARSGGVGGGAAWKLFSENNPLIPTANRQVPYPRRT